MSKLLHARSRQSSRSVAGDGTPPRGANADHPGYSEYYGSDRLARWRELCAHDKAANIMTLWRETRNGASCAVADIGCGDGAVIQELSRQGFGRSFVGFEISRSGLEYARTRHYEKPVSFVMFDGTQIPAPDKSFDVVLLTHVLEHVESPRGLLREAARIAQYVIAEVPLELHARTSPDFHLTEVGHNNLFNPLLLRHLFQSLGLTVLDEQITCPSRAVFTFHRPVPAATLDWAAKAALLKIVPRLAHRLWTYHGSVIASSA
jgi:ubiquinone/menaquinone biosynthesis C-methylase UbiE